MRRFSQPSRDFLENRGFKKACGSGSVRVEGRGFERGEVVSPIGCIAGKSVGFNLAMPDARHRRPLKFLFTLHYQSPGHHKYESYVILNRVSELSRYLNSHEC